ncbi:MAG: hypothetical protein ACKPKO_46430 [Candidatus Fonsibacter sp.]
MFLYFRIISCFFSLLISGTFISISSANSSSASLLSCRIMFFVSSLQLSNS